MCIVCVCDKGDVTVTLTKETYCYTCCFSLIVAESEWANSTFINVTKIHAGSSLRVVMETQHE